jgi:hypothetical protein
MRARRLSLKFRRRRSIFRVNPIDLGDPRQHGGCPEDSQMSLDVAPIGPINASAASDATARRAGVRPPEDASAVSSGAIPERPPAEVLDAIGAAADRHAELEAQGHQLRFVLDSDEDGGGVTVELHDLDGTLLRTLAPSEALDVATGAAVE